MKLLKRIEEIGINCFVALYTHTGSVCTGVKRKSLQSIKENNEMEGFAGEKWQIQVDFKEVTPNSANLDFLASLSYGTAPSATAGLEFDLTNWSREVYTVIPGAVYAGNRFPSFPSKYPPLPRPCKPDESDGLPQISEVPRLAFEDGHRDLNN